MIPDLIRVTLHVAETLERLGISYLVGGSVASTVHGEPRTTEDVDIVADLRPEHMHPLVMAMKEAFYIDEEDVQAAVQQRSSFNIIHLKTVHKVDIFLPKDRPIDREEMRRRKLTVVTKNPEHSLYLATAEDVILQKLDWYRRGGDVSDRQWRDVLGVLKVQIGRLDLAYLQHWAKSLDLTELLTRALRETGISE